MIIAKAPLRSRHGKAMFYAQHERTRAAAYALASEVMAQNMMEEDAGQALMPSSISVLFIEKLKCYNSWIDGCKREVLVMLRRSTKAVRVDAQRRRRRAFRPLAYRSYSFYNRIVREPLETRDNPRVSAKQAVGTIIAAIHGIVTFQSIRARWIGLIRSS